MEFSLIDRLAAGDRSTRQPTISLIIAAGRVACNAEYALVPHTRCGAGHVALTHNQ
jgi:hypothetical protein